MLPAPLISAVVATFIAAGFAAGVVAYLVSERFAPERRRLRHLLAPAPVSDLVAVKPLSGQEEEAWADAIRLIPKSPKDLSRLRRRLTQAGYPEVGAVVAYAAAELLIPVAVAVAALLLLSPPVLWVVGGIGIVLGFMLPGLWLDRQLVKRQRAISDGLPDALDLLIVCLEAGTSLDQAILKTSGELQLVYPALADELRMIITETRAGKPRLEAFRNFATRTRLDEVRSLVSMLVQTDRFGTSVAQALRVQADGVRVQRRQRAEEAAQKIGVKLVFPLVLLLFPALYVVMLGPAVIQFIRTFMN